MSSSSTKDTTSHSAAEQPKSGANDDPKKQLAAEKKKLKVLKNALKDERAMREQIEKELKLSNEKVEQVRGQLAEKDSKYMQLYEENMKLQEALIRESKAGQAAATQNNTLGGNIGKLINLALKKEDSKQVPTTAPAEEQSTPPVVDNALVAKCKAQEETILKKDDEINKLQEKLMDSEVQIRRIQEHFESQLNQVILEKEGTASERDQLIIKLREKNDQMEQER